MLPGTYKRSGIAKSCGKTSISPWHACNANNINLSFPGWSKGFYGQNIPGNGALLFVLQGVHCMSTSSSQSPTLCDLACALVCMRDVTSYQQKS